MGGCKKQYITKRLLLKCYSSYLSSSDTFYDILSDFAQIHGEPRWHTKIQGSKTGPCSNLTTSHVTRENTVGCVTNKTHGLVNTYMHKRHFTYSFIEKREKNQNDKTLMLDSPARPRCEDLQTGCLNNCRNVTAATAEKFVPKKSQPRSQGFSLEGGLKLEKVAQKYTHYFSVISSTSTQLCILGETRAVTSSWGRKNKRKLTRRFSSAPTKCSWVGPGEDVYDSLHI